MQSEGSISFSYLSHSRLDVIRPAVSNRPRLHILGNKHGSGGRNVQAPRTKYALLFARSFLLSTLGLVRAYLRASGYCLYAAACFSRFL
jgi:hypothetical protein